MQHTHFFSDIDSNENIEGFVKQLEKYSNENNIQTYLISGPLGEKKYTYTIEQPMILLIPDHQIMLINCKGEDSDDFLDFHEDFLEDLGHLSDKFEYKKVLGRPRIWRKELVSDKNLSDFSGDIEEFISNSKLDDPTQKRKVELLISLLIGSINSIDKIGHDLPEELLDKVKRKITLFDSDQTRFIFKKIGKKRITIQGIAGTGKTELLLHKLKELYTEDNTSKIAFTCFNKALASTLKSRVPNFFDFMKVEEQIKWGERLWIMHSWGSQLDRTNVGLYSYICRRYGIPFYGLSNGSFDYACKKAIEALKGKAIEPAFDYVLIDESQDFQESFFELCELVTRDTVYVAGDIFQNIFQANVTDTSPDFLLNKCYRTDPKTLMFAHAVGFGLFERPAIRWLSQEQWEACGYYIEDIKGDEYTFSRTPLRKFNDLEEANVNSAEIIEASNKDCSENIIEIIKSIRTNHPSVKPEDIAIVFTDKGNSQYELMTLASLKISDHFNWKSNKIYDTKEIRKDSVSISNINNIKGLEFPFIICIANSEIGQNVRKRNALYMTLTRSFITSYLIVNRNNNQLALNRLHSGLESINEHSKLIVKKPSEGELIDQSELVLDVNVSSLSQRDIVDLLFDKHKIPTDKHEKLRNAVQTLQPDSVDKEQIEKIILQTKDLV